ncbi:MAG: divergent polysaccharide deacetylase family protein [Variibacter sp.]|nr:divergent polysaccharide deacetylase family protein [Variibacter sp.]
MTDEFDVPLGQGPKKSRRLVLPKFVPHAVLAVLGAAVAGFVGWALVVDDPLGGEPMAVATIGGSASVAAQKEPSAAPGGVAARPKAANADIPATQTVTIIDGMSGKRQQIVIPASGEAEDHGPGAPGGIVASSGGPMPGATAPAQPAGGGRLPSTGDKPPTPTPDGAELPRPDPRLTETSRHGPIPRIGPDGTRPSEVYASPLARAGAARPGAQIAIVVARLGVSAKGTDEALAKLPAAVTLAFAPYGADLDRLAAQARAGGHEVLLQVPMEPFDYPDNDPGPQTLLTSLSPEQNVDRLHWFMSRFQGYVGIGNYMGARFAGNEAAVSAVMRELAKRGLLYFDDGTATRSLVSQVAAANAVPFARADIIVDTGRSAAEIDAALTRLEAIARERGSAVGVAIPLPSSIEHIARWAAAAAARGISLVPISVIANKPKSS